jgi:N-acetylglucosaminyldiphosphoundecaprenol N-acetyl-beta-D-mannosaminyltransferase
VPSVIELAGIPICQIGLEGAINMCAEHVEQQRGGYVCFVNVHSLTEATRHVALREALQGAAFCFADGMPLVWLSRLKQSAIESRVAGPDFMTAMLQRERGQVHGFIGGVPGHAEAIADRFGAGAVIHCPPVRPFSPANAVEDWEQFVAKCPAQQPPRLVWVALGAPKQELWLASISKLAPTVTFFGVGAAFDFLAGASQRAPLWARRAGLEWVHRFASEPRRLWMRYLVSNARFVRIVLDELL